MTRNVNGPSRGRVDASASPARVRGTGLLSVLSLFTSLGTILCCALPLLLVVLGLGASWAALISAAPWLVPLTRHKNLVFGVAGALIFGNLLFVYRIAPSLRARGEACAVGEPGACDVASRLSRVVLWSSAAIWMIGFATAYVLPRALGL